MADIKRAIPDAHHETRDISEGFVWGAVALLLASLIAIALLVLWLFPQSLEDRTIQGSLPSYPEPPCRRALVPTCRHSTQRS